MARFSGPQHRGAGRARRRESRLEAEARDEAAWSEYQASLDERGRDCE